MDKSCCVLPAVSALSAVLAVDEDKLAALCKALGHPARIRILRVLLEKQECVCGDLVEVLPLAQSTVSEHLRILKEAGWVTGRIDGPRRCYCVAPDVVQLFKSMVTAL